MKCNCLELWIEMYIAFVGQLAFSCCNRFTRKGQGGSVAVGLITGDSSRKFFG